MGMTIDVLLDFANVICKIAFITYTWLTMIRVNAYIKENKDGNNDNDNTNE